MKTKPYRFPNGSTDKRKTLTLSLLATTILSDKFTDAQICGYEFTERRTPTSRTEMFRVKFTPKTETKEYTMFFTFTIQNNTPIIEYFDILPTNKAIKMAVFETIKPDFMKICTDCLLINPIETV